MERLEVFADVSCPFAHVGLQRIVAERTRRGLHQPRLHVRPWPLELVNGSPLTGDALAPKIEALRTQVAPDLFTGFDPTRFPVTTLPVLAAEAAAHATDPEVGERFSLAVRTALFEHGIDPSAPEHLARLLADHGIAPDAVDPTAVTAGWTEGRERGVLGSPHFFAGEHSWFCPSLTIRHDADGYDIAFDVAGLEAFLADAFGR